MTDGPEVVAWGHRRHDAALRRRCAKYGLTVEEYETLLLAQDHRCAGCGKRFSPSRPAHIDHSHDTWEVRGLLCGPCNTLIGYLHDDGDLLRRLSNHLILPIASRIFDIPKRHRDAPPERTTP